MSDRFDVLIVGSGPAGVHAAFPLVEAGLRVAMVDGGGEPPAGAAGEPDLAFDEMRAGRGDQHRWFLGDDFSGIPLDSMGIGLRGSIVSGRRSFVTSKTNELLPVDSEGTQVIQSLAKGGLGRVWGAMCAYYSAAELEAMGLPAAEMEKHYDVVTERIGVSGPLTRRGIQPATKLDHHAQSMVEAYKKKQDRFESLRISLSQPHSAVLTEDRGGRQAVAYRDMEYWTDPGRSIYRPHYTLEELQKSGSFEYFGGRLVQTVKEDHIGCTVNTVPVNFSDGEKVSAAVRSIFQARYVVMAAGAVGTARILLRSLGLYDKEIPFLAKPHWLLACLNPKSIGAAGAKERLSLCQLILKDKKADEPGGHLSAGYAQLYSYKSMGLIRMLGFIPAPIPEALGLFSLLVPSLVIADLRFPLSPDAGKTLSLVRSDNGGDQLRVRMRTAPGEFESHRDSMGRLRRAIKLLGLLPLKMKALAYGSTAHYAGTVPHSAAGSGPALSVDESGRLRQAEKIFVADSSVFRFMPAKSICMTIMANANRVGENVRELLTAGVAGTKK